MHSAALAIIIVLVVALAWTVTAHDQNEGPPGPTTALTLESLKSCPGRAVQATASAPAEQNLQLIRQWIGRLCKSTLTNAGPDPIRVRQIVLFSVPHDFPGSTAFYGEGFTMLSQTGGTIADPVDLGSFSDRAHYRIPQPPGATTVYGLLTISPRQGPHILMAFTSCRRFIGSLRVRPERIDVVLDLENLEIPPGQSWPLEEFMYAEGPDRDALLKDLADRIAVHHPPLRSRQVPTGWCSWYCFGPGVTFRQIEANLDVIPNKAPGLRFFQIDDGYQAAMGDWLITREDFGGDLPALCRRCKARGLEVGIWVAPFVAEENSRIFREHSDWFVRDENGKPLRSDQVTFGGWRRGPWYVLDGSHPAVANHLENLFRILNREWGCTYFKLDANFWGAIHGGRHHDPNATRIEAYRRGMEAILRGAGDSFILGCNHPMWPSLGLIHGSRSSMDIESRWDSVRLTAREAFCRNWQNATLWYNDPDVLMLAGDHSSDYLHTRAAVVLAAGGLVLAGDDLAALPDERLAILQKLLPPAGVAARFDPDFTVGTIDLPGQRRFVLFNWTGRPVDRDLPLPGRCRILDFWTGKDLGIHTGQYHLHLPPQSSRIFVCEPVGV
jgi:alpha-galactosidase